MSNLQPANVQRSTKILGPASLSNLGPGFDALGLCVAGWGDVVEVERTDEPGVRLAAVRGLGTGRVPASTRNTAVRAAQGVLRQAGTSGGLVLRLTKGIPLGSGIGGSAASAVAGAWAANVALGGVFTKADLVEAVLDGEALASGARHGDNVLPALFGGLVLVDPADPRRYRHVELPRPLPLAVLLPEVEILTEAARGALPTEVPLRDAVANAASLGFLIDAFRAGDWPAVGEQIMRDQLVEPIRARQVPGYAAIREAALEAGACGCALSGSGPAMFAVAETARAAEQVRAAMEAACRAAGAGALSRVTEVDSEGARTLVAVEEGTDAD